MSISAVRSSYQARDVTVVVTPDRERICELEETIGSIRRQNGGSPEIVVATHEKVLATIVNRLFPDVRVVRPLSVDGIRDFPSGEAEATPTALLAFVDEGATVAADWLQTLLPHFDDDCVGGVEPLVSPEWDGGERPAWFPSELDWALGCTHSAYPSVSISVRNAFGTGVIVRRDLLNSVDGLRVEPNWAADAGGQAMQYADLCLRMRRAHPETRFLHDPATLVRQPVAAARTTWRYLARRCYAEGRGTASLMRDGVPVAGTISMDKRLLTRVLPETVARNLFQVTLGHPLGAGRAAAVVGGMACTAVGYFQEQHRRA